MNFDVEDVAKKMLEAALPSLRNYGKYAVSVAAMEFRQIALIVQQIGEDRQQEKITPQDAEDQLVEAKLAYRSAMDAQAGMATIAAEDAINAALGAVSSIVNGYLGFALI